MKENRPQKGYTWPTISMSYDDETECLEVSVTLYPSERNRPPLAASVGLSVPPDKIGDLNDLGEILQEKMREDNEKWLLNMRKQPIFHRLTCRWTPNLSGIIIDAICDYTGEAHHAQKS